ncbi:NACHT domain-containing protein [Actinomycetes bacterium KLBMP 9797]
MRRVWRWGVPLGVAFAVVGTGWVWLRYDLETVSWTWAVIAGIAAVFGVLAQLVKDRGVGPGVAGDLTARREVADGLAALIRGDPADDALLRTLDEPYPLPVSWRNAADRMQPSWRTIGRSSDAGPLDLGGRADGLRACYQRIPSGRLLILGAPGSGKSVLAVRLARDLATGGRADRIGRADRLDREPDHPIPVLLAAATWDPETPFHEWLVAQLAARYPELVAVHPRLAGPLADLLESGAVLPILDGLDEVSDEHATRCLEELNALPSQRLVVTCQTAAYERYLQAGGEKLRGAAVIVIDQLSPERVAEYLVDAAPPHQAAGWAEVAAGIGPGGEAELTAALGTPLMVALARTAYDDPASDPRELAHLARARGGQSVEDTLLTSVVDAALRSRRRGRVATDWRPDAARQYLSFLAGHLESVRRREFAWWRLPAAVPGSFWALFDGVRAALAVAVALELCGPAIRAVAGGRGPLTDHRGWWVIGGGAAVAVLSLIRRDGWSGVRPRRVAFRGGLRPLGAGVYRGLWSGMLLGFAAWVVLMLLTPPVRLEIALPGTVRALPDEFVLAVAAGLAWLLSQAAWAGLRVDTSAPVTGDGTAVRLVRGDRAATAISLAAEVAAATTLVYGLAGAWWLLSVRGAPSWTAQTSAGVGLGLAVWLHRRAGGAWVRFGVARVLLALQGRTPLRLLRFLAFAEQVGLLRGVGGGYRFRHGRLQSRLAATTDRAVDAAWRRQEFATELALAGYWEEALGVFGAALTARVGVGGVDDDLTVEALRKAVLVGCAGGRWRRTEEYLASVPAPVTVTSGWRAEIAAKRREIGKLVYHGTAPATLLEYCDDLIDLEAAAGRLELSTLEFRAVLLLALGETGAAAAHVRRVLTGLRRADDVERSAPVAAAVLARIALVGGDGAEARDITVHELRRRWVGPETDPLLLAESWRWSVRVLGQTFDELADLRHRLRAAAGRAAAGDRTALRRLPAEMAIAGAWRVIDHPLLGGVALLAVGWLLERVADPDSYRSTVERSAPLWS